MCIKRAKSVLTKNSNEGFITALQAATILVAMASEKKIGDWIIGESRHLATKGYKLKRIKLTSRFIAF